MTFGDKLSQKRKEYHYTQEQLAEILGVSRQAISKWESGLTYPETDKMIRMCELFHCSLDYMVRDMEETGGESQKAKTETPFFKKYLCERKSQKRCEGYPYGT